MFVGYQLELLERWVLGEEGREREKIDGGLMKHDISKKEKKRKEISISESMLKTPVLWYANTRSLQFD